jgi:response regulator RpfG family c-di-GMP phosphodiesterase
VKIPIKLLLVEDSDDDAQLILRELQRGEYSVEFERVETAENLRAALTRQTWDLIISDYSLPQFNAPAALALLQDMGIDLPFIIASGTIGEETAISALKAGAHDFVIKGNLARLIPAIEREMRDAKVRNEHIQRERELEAIAAVGAALRKSKSLDEMLSHLLDNTLEIIQVRSGSIWLYDATTDEVKLTVHRAWDVKEPNTFVRSGEDIPGHVVRTGTSIISREFCSDTRIQEKNRSHLAEGVGGACIPLFSNENIVGVLFIQINLPREVSIGETRILNALAEIGGNALHRANLLEQSIKQIEQLNSLRTIDIAISTLGLKSALDTVLDQVISQLKVDAAAILLIQPETNHLVYSGGRGFRTELIKSTNMPIGKGNAGRAALEKKVVFIKDLSVSEESFVRDELRDKEEFVCYFAVPFIAKGETKGVLEIFNRSPLRIDMEWLNFLDTLSWQTAIAVDNALLFERLQRSNSDLEMAYNATIEGWSYALDLRDKETEGHSLRVTEMTLKLAAMLDLSAEQLINIKRGALLHDIGKMGVPDSILLKPEALTKDEWEIMQRHPQFAYDLLSPISYLHDALEIPYSHHEKWDGSGYPRKLAGEQIPLSARIFAVVDVWDALTNERPYRPAWPKEKVIEHIRADSGTHFDPQIVEMFLENIVNITR